MLIVLVRDDSRMDTILLSKPEAARMLGLSVRSIDHLISKKKLPTRRIGKRVLITRSAVETFASAESSTEITREELG